MKISVLKIPSKWRSDIHFSDFVLKFSFFQTFRKVAHIIAFHLLGRLFGLQPFCSPQFIARKNPWWGLQRAAAGSLHTQGNFGQNCPFWESPRILFFYCPTFITCTESAKHTIQSNKDQFLHGSERLSIPNEQNEANTPFGVHSCLSMFNKSVRG